jgi:hypothetical protein
MKGSFKYFLLFVPVRMATLKISENRSYKSEECYTFPQNIKGKDKRWILL